MTSTGPVCCEAEARRGLSMEALRRKASADAERDLLSCSAPNPKRIHLDTCQQTTPSPCEPGHVAEPLPSVFNMPTGNLTDRFQVSDTVLGCGQFGLVRECRDLFSGDSFACKSMKKRLSGKTPERQFAELRNEVGVMLRLGGHENVVQLRGVFEDNEQVHLVMDKCEGGELFNEVVRRQCFSEPDAAFLFAEIAKAVAFCHSRGVVHRDLKPENVLLTRPLQSGASACASSSKPLVKLADFGLATVLSKGQRVRGIAGSPFYMAPEVLSGEYDTKADVWSLGVVLYILLCGSPPFWGEKDSEVFHAIMRGRPDLVSGPWGAVSPEAKNLVRCLLVQDPSKRPSAQRALTHPWVVRHTVPAHRRVVLARRPVPAAVASTAEQAVQVL